MELRGVRPLTLAPDPSKGGQSSLSGSGPSKREGSRDDGLDTVPGDPSHLILIKATLAS